ncbi:ORF085 [Saltwater crocodilepox virus]|nr:ORF085 [Saltwater crocodilepox virus]QGT47812.1 ORF084 [Saltwater crocodilepox virus]QGT48022.1 ORF085 [Saltwater crocodilepox virus]QGT48236.1 ORF085 [Saltwater crocodilepox virus]QGT48452.1 ORF085 [Saltwater crocodilepox virus]
MPRPDHLQQPELALRAVVALGVAELEVARRGEGVRAHDQRGPDLGGRRPDDVPVRVAERAAVGAELEPPDQPLGLADGRRGRVRQHLLGVAALDGAGLEHAEEEAFVEVVLVGEGGPHFLQAEHRGVVPDVVDVVEELVPVALDHLVPGQLEDLAVAEVALLQNAPEDGLGHLAELAGRVLLVERAQVHVLRDLAGVRVLHEQRHVLVAQRGVRAQVLRDRLAAVPVRVLGDEGHLLRRHRGRPRIVDAHLLPEKRVHANAELGVQAVEPDRRAQEVRHREARLARDADQPLYELAVVFDVVADERLHVETDPALRELAQDAQHHLAVAHQGEVGVRGRHGALHGQAHQHLGPHVRDVAQQHARVGGRLGAQQRLEVGQDQRPRQELRARRVKKNQVLRGEPELFQQARYVESQVHPPQARAHDLDQHARRVEVEEVSLVVIDVVGKVVPELVHGLDDLDHVQTRDERRVEVEDRGRAARGDGVAVNAGRQRRAARADVRQRDQLVPRQQTGVEVAHGELEQRALDFAVH